MPWVVSEPTAGHTKEPVDLRGGKRYAFAVCKRKSGFAGAHTKAGPVSAQQVPQQPAEQATVT